MDKIKLCFLKERFSIHRLPVDAEIPRNVLLEAFYSICRNQDEITVVVTEDVTLESERKECGWACIKVPGPLDFGLTGILSGISGTLARAGISIFAISTFDSDYILVKKESVHPAKEALAFAGYSIMPAEEPLS